MSDNKIEEIRITLALNPKQIAERILSGEVTSDSHFVSQEDHLHVASLLDAAHREIAKLRAEIERLREALRRYAHQYCELGEASEGCGKLPGDECGGCPARAALEGKP